MSNQVNGIVKAIRKDRKGLCIQGADGNDTWYSAPFNTVLPENVQQGSNVTFTFVAKGNFNNIEKGSLQVQQPDPAAAQAATPKAAAGNMYPVKIDTKDHIIMRQNALTAASNCARFMFPDGCEPADVLAVAEVFVGWTTGRNTGE